MPTPSSSSSSSGSAGSGCDFINAPSSGSCVVAVAQVGDNALTGTPEFTVGRNTSPDMVSGQIKWTNSLSAGFDTGSVDVELDMAAGGGAGAVNWTVTGGTPTPLTYGGVTYGYILQVQILAAVTGPHMKMTWRNISVQFLKNGHVNESVTLSTECNPVADTLTASSSTGFTQGVVITPKDSDNTGVVVSGKIRMQCSTPNVLPDAHAIHGDIYVFASDCNPV